MKSPGPAPSPPDRDFAAALDRIRSDRTCMAEAQKSCEAEARRYAAIVRGLDAALAILEPVRPATS